MIMRSRLWGIALGAVLLGALAPAWGQVGQQLEVPAILDTYRADPSAVTGPLTRGTVNLSARAVRELYYESFVAGYMQGEPTGSVTAFGLPASAADYGVSGGPALTYADSYPILARTLQAADRMPRMPITRSPGPDGVFGTADDQLLLHLRIWKLPSKATCQKVVQNMINNGLLPPGDAASTVGDTPPQATGRWRIIIHPPRAQGAPPAPSLYYPEAIGAITPKKQDAATSPSDNVDNAMKKANAGAAAFAAFWGKLMLRWRDWDHWVRDVYTTADDPNQPGMIGTPADDSLGQEPQPLFLPYPRYLDTVRTTPIDHTQGSDRTKFTPAPAADAPGQFFDPTKMWENRLLDPNQEAAHDGSTAPSSSAPDKRIPAALTNSEVPGNGPIELLINVDGSGRSPGWWLRGVHTTGPSESSAPADPEYSAYVDVSTSATPVGTGSSFVLLNSPLDLTVNMLNGQVSTNGGAWAGTPRPQPIVPGVGMVEMQFEYETTVPGQPKNDLDQDWKKDPWSDGKYGTPDTPPGKQDYWQSDTTLANPRGSDAPGTTNNQSDDRPIPAKWLTYALKYPADATTPQVKTLRDPLNQVKGSQESTTKAWRIHRYSGWPFNPAVIGLPNAFPNAPSYQGGPIVCRFLVSAIAPIPENQRAETAGLPALGKMAEYNPASGRYYPQVRAWDATYGGSGSPTPTDYLQRASYLLGYRADIPQTDEGNAAAGPGQDYFFPIRPGSSSEAHQVFIQSVLDQTPGGTHCTWAEPAQASDAEASSDDKAYGHRLTGFADIDAPDPLLAANWDHATDDPQPPRYLAYTLTDTGANANLPTDPVTKMLVSYAVSLTVNGQTTNTPVAGVKDTDAGRENVQRAFDGDTSNPGTPAAGEPPLVSVPAKYTVGEVFPGELQSIDRIEVHWHRADGSAAAQTDWAIQFGTEGTGGQVQWIAAPGAWPALPTYLAGEGALTTLAGTTNAVGSLVPTASGNVCRGVRVRANYAGSELVLDELRIITHGDIKNGVTASLKSPRQSSDPGIRTSSLPASSVDIEPKPEREISAEGDNVTPTTVRVHVPRYQPPSRDAVERQILSDQGNTPGSYATANQPLPSWQSVAGQWDRYRGEGRVYVDDSRERYAQPVPSDGSITDTAPGIANHWDANLYQLRGRFADTSGANPETQEQFARPATTQFVSWYEEDSGWVGMGTYQAKGGASVYTARLVSGTTGTQHVAVEPYCTFDIEFSVAYDRRMSVAEKLIDFGKVTQGGVSQWVPITLVNDGNVPLRAVKLYLSQPLTNIALTDRAGAARMAQIQPLPSWFAQNLSLQASTDGTTETTGGSLNIDAPAVGSPQGRSAGDVYLRIGRLDPVIANDRRVPVGQPIGNYTGRVQAFCDDLGVPGTADTPAPTPNPTGAAHADLDDLPDSTAETNLGGVATMKLTVQESPLWRIKDFMDNDVTRNDRSSTNGIKNLLPYDPDSGIGTYQPIPEYVRAQMYSDPDSANATPAVTVIQDQAEFAPSGGLPNEHDLLWVAWSSLRDYSGTPNWGLFFQSAGRAVFSGIAETNYRGFLWPDATAGAPAGINSATTRNLYPNLCVLPNSSATNKQFLLLWHAEQNTASGRASYLKFQRWTQNPDPASPPTVLQIPDDASGAGLVNKQIPRAFVSNVDGNNVLFVGWQSGDTGRTRFGFNAINLPSSTSAAASAYTDAIGVQGNQFNNYALVTPPGLTNVMEPYLLPSYRGAQSNAANSGGAVQALNVLYSAWSPLWQNQDIYWSRYKPIEDPTAPTITTATDGLKLSPMAEDAYRLGVLTTYPGRTTPGYYVRTLPGGRVPFPRMVNELLQTNDTHTVYAAGGADWVMPPDHFRYSHQSSPAPGWMIETFNHRGFADTLQPLFDSDRYAALSNNQPDPNLDPLVVLKVYQATSLYGGPSTNPSGDPAVQRVAFDLPNAFFDPSTSEWVLPITGPALLTNQGITAVRVHPGLGRVSFSKPLYRRGSTNPIYVYATYRPCAWRVTTDNAVDSQPSAAFDWWERMVIVWRRTVEGGKGQLWYRTFSLAVPLDQAPATRLNAVVNDADSSGDLTFNGTVGLTHWSFVGASGGSTQEADGAWSELNRTTGQNFTLTKFDTRNLVKTDASQGSDTAGYNAASMVYFGFDDVGKTARIWYTTGIPGMTNPIEEAHRVPGFGPERLVPMDGAVNESQPSIAPESFYVGYPLGTSTSKIMSTRFWLAWISTRDLLVPDPTPGNPARLGQGGTNVFYGGFMPDYSTTGAASP